LHVVDVVRGGILTVWIAKREVIAEFNTPGRSVVLGSDIAKQQRKEGVVVVKRVPHIERVADGCPRTGLGVEDRIDRLKGRPLDGVILAFNRRWRSTEIDRIGFRGC